MKYLISALALLSTPSLFANAEDYITKIVQVNTYQDEAGNDVRVEKLLTDLPAEGTKSAAEGIMGRSVFQLIAQEKKTGTENLLDSTAVSSYAADADIEIIGPPADTYNLTLQPGQLPRTQVGQGFTLKYKISGLLDPGPEISDAATQLTFTRDLYSYAPGATSVNTGVLPDNTTKSVLDKNGEFIYQEYTALQAADMTTVRGEEHFSIFMNPDYKVDDYAILDDAKIIVWPISNGTMSGLEQGKKYRTVPIIQINLVDLYPTSNTYLYITSPVLDTPITYGARKNTEEFPISANFNLTELDKLLEKNGTYTVQLIHDSPFESLEFAKITIQIDRSIRVNGNITDSE